MRIVISGGTGLVGQALTKSLISDGHEVILLSRDPRNEKLLAGAREVAWNPPVVDGWASELDGADVVVNLAGASIKGDGFLPSRWTARRKQLIRQSRIDVGQAIVAATQRAKSKPRVLIQASAVGYYGPRGDETIVESSPAGSDFLASVCRDWEASTAEVGQMGVRRIVIRTGLPLTLKGGAFPLLVLPFRLFSGNWFGSGNQYYPWIHFEDYIAAIRFLMENETATGVYNLSAPNPVTNHEFAKTLGRVMTRPVWLPVPGFAIRLALGEVSTVVLDGQRVVPQKLTQQGFQFRFPELETALRDLLK